jgi:hypothetical protein
MRERTIFFPLALIAAGGIWLLINMGQLPVENLWALARIWPFLLIAAGLSLLIRAWWAPARILIAVLMIAAIVLAILFAPQLGWNTPQWNFGFTVGGGLAGSGKIVTETRPIGAFNAIDLSYPAEVLVQQAASESLSLTADDNLLPQLGTSVRQGTLLIENTQREWNRRVNPTKAVQIVITVKNLQDIDFSSAGSLRIAGLETDRLSLSVSGAGSLNLEQLSTSSLDCDLSGVGSIDAAGTADRLNIDISGLGSFKGSDLHSQDVTVNLSGAGSAVVNAQNTLYANLSGTGSVTYYGHPAVNQQVSGLGSVHPASGQ